MSDENSIEEANGDELEAMFARAAMEEEGSQTEAATPDEPEQMHDPLSGVVNEEVPEEEPDEVSLDELEEDEEPEVDFIGGENAEIEIPEEMEEEDGDEPEVDFISEAIGDDSPAEAEAEAEEPNTVETVEEESAAAPVTPHEDSAVSRLEDSILNAVELAHEAADLANDATEIASSTTIEMRELIHDALKQIEVSQPEASSAVIVSDEMNEYIDELKKHSDAIRERTQQLRDRIQSLTND